jgi:hypothetical protein
LIGNEVSAFFRMLPAIQLSIAVESNILKNTRGLSELSIPVLSRIHNILLPESKCLDLAE